MRKDYITIWWLTRLTEIENPFDKAFLPYIIAGLTSFDMGRMMGTSKYSFDNGCFAARLSNKLHQIRSLLEPLLPYNLVSIDLKKHVNKIKQAYKILAANGPSALHEDQTKAFHVGATKILHFLQPDLFIIIDSNAARAFRATGKIPFRYSTQPGYSAERYLTCMQCIKDDISEFGLEKFKALEPKTPLTRIYDKLTFVSGAGLA